MLSPTSTRRLLAGACVAAVLLAACATEGPTSPSARPGTPLLAKGGGTFSGGAPAPAPAGPLSGTWSGSMTNDAATIYYDVSLTIVQKGTGISGTFTQNSRFLERPVTQDAAGGVSGGQVSLTLRPQKGKPSAPSTSYVGTLSADSTTITLRGVANGVTIVVSR